MPIITVAQRKGGAGKTTVAVSLAAEFSRRYWDVALIDSDPQRSSGQWAELGNLTFPVYEIALADNAVAPWATAVRGVIAECVIIDTAPNERSLGASIALADLVLVPCTPSGLDLEATMQTLNIIQAVRQRRSAPMNVILIPNRVDYRTLEGRQLADELLSFGETVAPPIKIRSAFVRAFAAGKSVSDLPGGDSATNDIRDLGDLVETKIRR